MKGSSRHVKIFAVRISIFVKQPKQRCNSNKNQQKKY